MRFIGIDGGGTKCHLALCDESGKKLAEAFSGGCNPNVGGMEAALSNIRGGLCKLLENFGGLSAEINGLFAGIAGSTTGNNRAVINEMLKATLPSCKLVLNDNDTFCAGASGLFGRDGGVLICGTGCIGLVTQGKKSLRVGGWGYLLDRGGSGYAIGRDGLLAALLDYDTRGEKTQILSLIARDYGKTPEEMIAEVYGGRVKIAQLCPLVFEASDNGDAVAKGIIAGSMRDAAGIVSAMQRFYGVAPCPIVLAGGLLSKRPELAELISAALSFTPDFIVPKAPPVLGAVVLAAQACRVAAAEAFADAFAQC